MRIPFGKARLRLAIERGIQNGGLKDELRELGEITPKSRSDGAAICWGLNQLNSESKNFAQQAYALAALFQEIDDPDSGACDVLREEGIPELIRIFDELRRCPDSCEGSECLFILKILALYGTTAGTLKIIEAAQQSFQPEGYLWSAIFSAFEEDHPELSLLWTSLNNPLPVGFIGISLLDSANGALLKGSEMDHPFDSPIGHDRLRTLLVESNPKLYSYAISATCALPFIDAGAGDALFPIAMSHPDSNVRIEAAWAAAKSNRPDGIAGLAEFCLNPNYANRAMRYLAELNFAEKIPLVAHDPAFRAKAEFAEWLSHPSELGRPPDELEIVDHRELNWPPARKQITLWLIKYRMRAKSPLERDDVDCGLVGSVTFCLFSNQIFQRPPEDAYAIHCVWELEGQKLIDISDVRSNRAEYEGLLQEWRGSAVENSALEYIAEVSPELNYPQRLLGIATAAMEGQPGWLVLDGTRSQWFSKSDFPEHDGSKDIIKIHLGRHFLGLTENVERKRYLVPPPPPKPATEIILGYEDLLLRAHRLPPGEEQGEAMEFFGPLGKHFESYANALIETGQQNRMAGVIQQIAPFWQHASGCGKLGSIAFVFDLAELAEKFLTSLKNDYSDFHRCEEMGMLADLWTRCGRADDARNLLLECLTKLTAEARAAPDGDEILIEQWYGTQRRSFLRLFPGEDDELIQRGFPTSILGTRNV